MRAKTPDTDNLRPSLPTPRGLSVANIGDESEISDGIVKQLDGNGDNLVDGHGQIVMDVNNELACCVPNTQKPTGYDMKLDELFLYIYTQILIILL